MKLLSSGLAVALLAFGLASVSQAAEPAAKTTKVEFGDLNLDGSAGQQALKDRITRAAELVCGPPASRSLADMQRYRACRDQSILAANESVHQQLAALAQPKTLTRTAATR